MKKVILATFALVATGTAAGESINETMDVSPDSWITVSNTAGDIEIEGWSRNQVEVTGELGSGVEELIFERHDDEITIKVKVPQHHSSRISSDLQIKVPETSSISVQGVSSDIDVSNVHGEQNLGTVSGDVETEVFGSDIEASSVSGDVELQGDDKDIRTQINSVSGDVEMQNIAGEVEASSVSGDVLIVDSEFDRASLNTTNGDLVFHARLRNGGRLQIETINGEVDVEFRGDVSAKFDISTFNGSISNCFGPNPERSNQYTPGYDLIFTEGDGSGRVTISTLNGDLRLCKE